MNIINIEKYLNELIYNLKNKKYLDTDDLNKILYIIYQEYQNNSNFIINNLLITLLYNYFTYYYSFEEKEKINNKFLEWNKYKNFLPQNFKNQYTNILNYILTQNIVKDFKDDD